MVQDTRSAHHIVENFAKTKIKIASNWVILEVGLLSVWYCHLVRELLLCWGNWSVGTVSGWSRIVWHVESSPCLCLQTFFQKPFPMMLETFVSIFPSLIDCFLFFRLVRRMNSFGLWRRQRTQSPFWRNSTVKVSCSRKPRTRKWRAELTGSSPFAWRYAVALSLAMVRSSLLYFCMVSTHFSHDNLQVSPCCMSVSTDYMHVCEHSCMLHVCEHRLHTHWHSSAIWYFEAVDSWNV
jgi:hypothetical protein